MVDADPQLVYEAAAQISGRASHNIAGKRAELRGGAFVPTPQNPGSREEGRRADIQQTVDETDTACLAIGCVPVRQARDCRSGGAD